jgi:hypothetical protein
MAVARAAGRRAGVPAGAGQARSLVESFPMAGVGGALEDRRARGGVASPAAEDRVGVARAVPHIRRRGGSHAGAPGYVRPRRPSSGRRPGPRRRPRPARRPGPRRPRGHAGGDRRGSRALGPPATGRRGGRRRGTARGGAAAGPDPAPAPARLLRRLGLPGAVRRRPRPAGRQPGPGPDPRPPRPVQQAAAHGRRPRGAGLRISLPVNGAIKQDSSTRDLYFTVPRIVTASTSRENDQRPA